MANIERDEPRAAAYSNPLPCETCEYCLAPIDPHFSRARNLFCEKYKTMENHKPSGVLWNNEECPNYKEAKKG